MENQFKQDTDTYFSERHSNVLIKFRNDNDKNFILSKSIEKQKETIKTLIPEDLWKEVHKLLDLIMLQSNIEPNSCIYKDSRTVLTYLIL